MADTEPIYRATSQRDAAGIALAAMDPTHMPSPERTDKLLRAFDMVGYYLIPTDRYARLLDRSDRLRMREFGVVPGAQGRSSERLAEKCRCPEKPWCVAHIHWFSGACQTHRHEGPWPDPPGPQVPDVREPFDVATVERLKRRHDPATCRYCLPEALPAECPKCGMKRSDSRHWPDTDAEWLKSIWNCTDRKVASVDDTQDVVNAAVAAMPEKDIVAERPTHKYVCDRCGKTELDRGRFPFGWQRLDGDRTLDLCPRCFAAFAEFLDYETSRGDPQSGRAVRGSLTRALARINAEKDQFERIGAKR